MRCPAGLLDKFFAALSLILTNRKLTYPSFIWLGSFDSQVRRIAAEVHGQDNEGKKNQGRCTLLPIKPVQRPQN